MERTLSHEEEPWALVDLSVSEGRQDSCARVCFVGTGHPYGEHRKVLVTAPWNDCLEMKACAYGSIPFNSQEPARARLKPPALLSGAKGAGQ